MIFIIFVKIFLSSFKFFFNINYKIKKINLNYIILKLKIFFIYNFFLICQGYFFYNYRKILFYKNLI